MEQLTQQEAQILLQMVNGYQIRGTINEARKLADILDVIRIKLAALAGIELPMDNQQPPQRENHKARVRK